MHPSTNGLLLGGLAALSLVSANPQDGFVTVTTTAGTGPTEGASLFKRMTKQKPAECSVFSSCPRNVCRNEYTYLNFGEKDDLAKDKKGCIAWDTGSGIGDACQNMWTDDQLRDMVEAVKKLTTKNGIIEDGEHNNWRAVWSLGTTGVPDQELYWKAFEKLLFQARDVDNEYKWEKGYKVWHFNFDGKMADIRWSNGWVNKCP